MNFDVYFSTHRLSVVCIITTIIYIEENMLSVRVSP